MALRLGSLEIRWYGIAYVVGIIAAAFVARYFAKRRKIKLSDDDLLTFLIFMILGVLLGGRLGYCLFYNPSYYFANPAQILAVGDGGMSFHGGLIGVIIAMFAAVKVLKIHFFDFADLAAIGTPIGLFFGRIANFINGELWGRVSDSKYALVFPGAGPLPRIPSQLIEAATEGILLFAIMIVIACKKPPVPRGLLSGVLLTGYGVARIFSEFFREPDAHIGYLFGDWLSAGMLLSLPMVFVGVGIIIWACKNKNEDKSGGKRS